MFQVYHLKYFNVRLARLGSLHIAIFLAFLIATFSTDLKVSIVVLQKFIFFFQ